MKNQLSTVLTALKELAPLRLAGSWDNVGLLLEPNAEDPIVSTGFLTIDLNEAVLREALDAGAELVVSYHPILFSGVQAITQANPHTRMLLEAIHHNVFIYSPHTALDAVLGGVNDWLVHCLGPVEDVRAIEPSLEDPIPTGMGRTATLKTSLPINEAVSQIKDYLSLPTLRVAPAPAHAAGAPIQSIAVCPGAGGSLLSNVCEQDLVITGELRHHDVLGLNARGVSVILTEHTNCERGYLAQLRDTLVERLGPDTQWIISTQDQDPLSVM